MTPVDVFFGVRALVRLGQAGQQALEQAVRDGDIVLPMPHVVRPTAVEFAAAVLVSADNRNRLRPGGDLVDLAEPQDPAHPPPVPTLRKDAASQIAQVEAANAIVADALRQSGIATTARASELASERAGLYVVRQWVKGDEPPPPLARIGLALAEIALDYAGANPSLFRTGAAGEKLIAAVALNLRELLPDPDNPADFRTSFAERATAIVFSASLSALAENTNVLIDEGPLADLAKGVIKPMVELATRTPGELPRWSAVRDSLLGPVAAAAARAVIDNQAAWLGAGFAPDKALGEITGILLEEAASGGLRGVVNDAGVARVYQGVLATISSNPAIIVGPGGGLEGDLLRDLLTRSAAVLGQAPKPFRGISGAALLDQSIAAFGAYLPQRIEGEGPWSELAVDALAAVLEGAGQAATGGAAVLAPARMEEFARLIFERAAATPQMIAGNGNAELTRVASALFATLARKDASLLSDEMWRDVAATALREVAQNPGALVGSGTGGDLHAVGFDYLAILLEVSADMLAQNGRARGNLLFGETLAEAAKITLEAAAEHAAHLAEAEVRQAYEALLRRLTKLAMDKAGQIGAQGWLILFGELVGPVLHTGALPSISDDELLELLIKEIA